MRELAVQSATDTNTDSDREKIQSETDQLAKELLEYQIQLSSILKTYLLVD
jgi:flagellin-like hook-associated protein FlgL